VPTLGPLELTTSRALYPVLLTTVVLAAVVYWVLMHSRVARAWYWVRADPSAAAAFGVPVVAYRMLAYAIAGVFAGLAGGLAVLWVQRLSGSAFPTTLSFTYLLVVVLTGPGYLGGLAVMSLFVEGGRLFSWFPPEVVEYLGPVGLVLTITKYQDGINGAGRELVQRVRSTLKQGAAPSGAGEPEPIGLGFVLGVVAILAGFVAIAVAWYHAGNTNQTWVQNQELISGGVGGLALVVVGVGLLIRDRLGRIQAELAGRSGSLRTTSMVPDHPPLDLLDGDVVARS
jgi:nitrate reductase gamma subunit